MLSNRVDQRPMTVELFIKDLFPIHLYNFFQTIYWVFLETFYQSNWIWRVNGKLQFRNYPTSQCANLSKSESPGFLIKFFENVRFLLSRTQSIPLHYGYWWRDEHSHSGGTQSRRSLCYSWNVSKNVRKLSFTWQMKDLVLHSVVRISDTFSEVSLAKNMEWCSEEKGLHKPKIA